MKSLDGTWPTMILDRKNCKCTKSYYFCSYAQQLQEACGPAHPCLFLQFDPSFNSADSLPIRVYEAEMGVQSFKEVSVQITTGEAERIGMDTAAKSQSKDTKSESCSSNFGSLTLKLSHTWSLKETPSKCCIPKYPSCARTSKT